MMAERVYNMERVIEQCHGGYTSGWPPRQLPCDEEDIFPAAVNAALSATTTNPAGARVLYFSAGVYEIRTPVYITQPGVTIRGEAGPYVFSPSADTSKATVFRCGISSTSAACLTLGPWTGSASGLVVEGVAWTWDTSVTAQEGVAGLRLRNLTASTVRRSYWENFPEDAVRIEDSAGCLFDELTFQWSGQGGANMISASDATDLHFRRITQNSGYVHGFRFEAVDDVEVESAVMHHTLGANVFLHNTGRVILRGIRFEVAGYPEEESRDYGVIHLTSDSAATPERTLDLVRIGVLLRRRLPRRRSNRRPHLSDRRRLLRRRDERRSGAARPASREHLPQRHRRHHPQQPEPGSRDLVAVRLRAGHGPDRR